jgi:hypothetical protein
MLMLGLSLGFQVDVELVTGLTILAVLVLLRSMIVRRRIGSDHQGILEELELELEPEPDLPQGMSESS